MCPDVHVSDFSTRFARVEGDSLAQDCADTVCSCIAHSRASAPSRRWVGVSAIVFELKPKGK